MCILEEYFIQDMTTLMKLPSFSSIMKQLSGCTCACMSLYVWPHTFSSRFKPCLSQICLPTSPSLTLLFSMIQSKQVSQVHTFLHYSKTVKGNKSHQFMKVFINDMTTYKLVPYSNISFKPQDTYSPSLPPHPYGSKHLKYNANTFDAIAKQNCKSCKRCKVS